MHEKDESRSFADDEQRTPAFRSDNGRKQVSEYHVVNRTENEALEDRAML